MKYFTADWHAGEEKEKVPFFPATHSYLRPKETSAMIQDWLDQCHKKIGPSDELYFLGDLGLQLHDLDVYSQLPTCRKTLILGDKEYASKHFSVEQLHEKLSDMEIFDHISYDGVVNIQGIEFFMSHKPSECLQQDSPALCGHVHGVWRTQEMPSGQPIINVGIDAWGGIVSEDWIIHQYNAVKKYYDSEAIIKRWYK